MNFPLTYLALYRFRLHLGNESPCLCLSFYSLSLSMSEIGVKYHTEPWEEAAVDKISSHLVIQVVGGSYL